MSMDANLINQFILAIFEIFGKVANLKLRKDSVGCIEANPRDNDGVATVLGITGDIKGQIILIIDEKMAMKFASAIMMGEPVNEYNEIAESGVCETVNMIAGDASRRLQELGYVCDLSTPSAIRGKSIKFGFSPQIPIFKINFSSDWGPVQMIVTLEVAKKNP